MFSSPTQANIKNKWKKNFFPIKEISSGSAMLEGATEETSGEEEGDRDEAGVGDDERGEEEGDGEEERDGEEEGSVHGEQELGKEWGHATLPKVVYVNNPVGTTRGTKTNAIWKTVKFLKMRTAHGTTVHNKYTHVCVTPITVSQAGEDGDVLRTETSLIYPWIPLILN